VSTTWVEVLDNYGRALLDFERAIEAGEAATAQFDFALPTGLGPLPPTLRQTATEVAQLSARVENQVRSLMEETTQAMGAVTRAKSRMTRERPRARFVDVET
jgi:hypothetical protein